MKDGEIVAQFMDPKSVTDDMLGEYMLGIKHMTTEEMAITANAIYDLSALSRSTRDSGKKIQYTMRLYVKDNSGDYKQTNDISKYLSSFTLETPHQAAV